MPDSPKFYYRDARIHGIPFQKYPEVHVFLGKYTAMDGTERERWDGFCIRQKRRSSGIVIRPNCHSNKEKHDEYVK